MPARSSPIHNYIPTVITDPPVEQRVSESASETGGSDAAAVPAASARGSGTVVEPEPAEVEEENREPQGKRKHTFSKKWLNEFTWLAQDSEALWTSKKIWSLGDDGRI